MDLEDALKVVDLVLRPEGGLNDLQEQIFRRTWIGQKYPQIAEELGYDPNYIKDLGAKTWKQLSRSLGEKVTKSNFQAVLRRWGDTLTANPVAMESGGTQISASSRNTPNKIGDWGDAVDTSTFVGRERELAKLSQWLTEDRCRLVAVVGTGGIGKTMLSSRLAERVELDFDVLVWRSLKRVPSLDAFLKDLLKRLGVLSADLEGETTTDLLLESLLEYLRSFRCLIVLDNTEMLLESGNAAGEYRAGYENWGELFQQVGTTRHQSCWLAIGREKFKEWIPLEGPQRLVRSWRLEGLNLEDSRALLATKGHLYGSEADWQQLVAQYGGNPLALQIIATTILDFFAGNVPDFLSQGQIVFDSLLSFLEAQCDRLSTAEQLVLFYLAIYRDATSLSSLHQDLLDPTVKRHLVETMNALSRRSLVEKNTRSAIATFYLQPAVLEYNTQKLIDRVKNEIVSSQIELLHQCPLLKGGSKDYIRQARQQFILQPILDALQSHFLSVAGRENHLRNLLENLRFQENISQNSYAVSNIVNLLIQGRQSLAGYDLSYLPLWDLNLQSVSLHDVNLAHCDLSQVIFADAFGGVLTAAFHPKGEVAVTGHEDGHLRLWDVDSGRQIKLLTGHSSWVWQICWTLDGEYLASGSEDRTIRVWQVATGECLQVLRGHGDRVWRVAVCPDGATIISASGDGTLKVWDRNSGQCLRTLTGHQGNVTALALANGKQIVSGGEDRTVRLWDLDSGNLLETWTSEAGWIWSVAYRAVNNTILAAGDGGVIQVWQSGEIGPIESWQKDASRIWSLDISPDDRYAVSGGDSEEVHLWDLETGAHLQTFTGYSGRIWSVKYDATGDRLVTASNDRAIRIWDVRLAQGLMTFQSYSNWVCEVVFSSDRTLVSAHEDGKIRVWNSVEGTLLQTLAGHQHQVWSIATHPQSHSLVSCSEDGSIRLWDLNSGNTLATLSGHRSRVWSVAFSPNGQYIASGSGDRTVKTWQVNARTCLHTLSAHRGRVWSVAFSPNGQYIASGSGDRTVKIWAIDTGVCVATLEGHTNAVLSVTFHPQQPWLISTGGDGCVKIWDLTAYTCMESFKVPAYMLWSVAASPDGQTIAIGGDDRSVRIWDIAQKCWKHQLFGHQGCIWSVNFSTDSQYLASGAQDGTFRLWSVTSGQCLQQIRPERLYESLNLYGVKGLTAAQLEDLQTLGAIVQPI
jgi:WD40 repeat protein